MIFRMTSIENNYALNLPRYNQVLGEARYIIDEFLTASDIKIHSILGRVKELDSILQKAERQNLYNSLEDITDIVGIRVICLLRSDIQNITDLISKSFDILSEDNKLENEDISTFGYHSVHCIAKLKNEHSGPRYDGIKNICFEIQIRTIAMDAWASVSHYVDYKTDHDVPNALKKDFHALSGLFYLADTHFELFYKAGIDSKKNAQASLTTKQASDTYESDQLNFDTLNAFLAQKFQDRIKGPASLFSQGTSELVSELTMSGYTNISKLEEAIDYGWAAYLQFEKENPPGDDNKKHINKGKKYVPVGAVRGVLSIVDDNFLNNRPRAASDFTPYRKLLPK